MCLVLSSFLLQWEPINVIALGLKTLTEW
jgi:hypothetical protein